MDSSHSTLPVPDGQPPDRGGVPVVGLGASAGGVQALEGFLREVPPEPGVAFVVLLHLAPDRESHIAEILARHVSLPVSEVTETVDLRADRVYVLSPRSQLELEGDRLVVRPLPPERPRLPIDRFFRSLAAARGEKAAGVVLSGTGRDGTLGLRAVREGGGIAGAQDPDEAEYGEMPRSAIEDGRASIVLPVAELPAEILRVLTTPGLPDAEPDELPGEDEELLRSILARVDERTGRDLSRYRRSTFLRRLDRRVRFSGAGSLREYARRLDRDPGEAPALVQDLLISVSRFFRDPEAFGALEREALPEIFEGKGPDEQVRAWVSGCATGEEAYSVAILLHEHASALDTPPVRRVFATDLDESALDFARTAHYPASVADDLSEERRGRFFRHDPSGFVVRDPIRESVLFAVHDVLSDPPFSRLDLVSCRNLLIYLRPDAQREVLERFHYGLRKGGYLLLGASESVETDLFEPVSKQARLYRRRRGTSPVPRGGALAASPTTERRPVREGRGAPETTPFEGLHGRLVRRHGPPSVLVDSRARILHLSEGMGRYLAHPAGAPTSDLMELVDPSLLPDVRTALHRALENGEATRRRVEGAVGDRAVVVELAVHPREEEGDRFALVVFDERPDVPTPGKTTTDVDDETVRELQEELRRTRRELQSAVEEREATIEELQSANEELQSVNEEQQATAEELETRREELQSANEELTTINQEHRTTIEQLGEVNADLRNLLEATETATLFLDEELRVRRFTASATEHFDLVPGDRGRRLAEVTHDLTYDGDLVDDARSVLDTLQRVEKEVTDAEDRVYIARILPYRSTNDRIAGVVLTFFDITERKEMEREAHRAREEAEAEQARLVALMDHLPAGVVIVDCDSRLVVSANQRAREILWVEDDGVPPVRRREEDRSSKHLPELEGWPVERVVETGEPVLEQRISPESADGRRRHLLVGAAPVEDAEGRIVECVVTMVDIEEVLEHAREREREAERTKLAFVATVSHEFRTPLNAIMGYTQLLTEGVPDPLTEAQARNVERIEICVRHLDFMVEQILNFSELESRHEAPEPAEIDPADVARDAESMVEREAASKGLELRVDAEGPPSIVSDPDKLRRILVNLVQNAVKFTEEGEVVVALAEREGGGATVEVRDTGVGIDPEDEERIFEPFWQAREGRRPTGVQGTGLGLAVVKELADILGGRLEVESEVGGGTTVRLHLPPDLPEEA